MKEIEPPFRLYDFLGYMFPGAATLHAYYILHSAKSASVLQEMRTQSDVMNVGLLVIASYAIGLMWSVLSREFLRHLLWKWSNPRLDGFNGSESEESPFPDHLAAAIRAKAVAMFKIPDLLAEQAHRLCRAYVAQHCATSWQQRQSVIAVRGMCANFIGPTLLYAGVFFSKGWCWFGLFAVAGTCLLTLKTVSLDEREWREVYYAFLITGRGQKEKEAESDETRLVDK